MTFCLFNFRLYFPICSRLLQTFLNGWILFKTSTNVLMIYSKFTEWAIASNTNVCYLTYAFENIPQSTFAIISTSREMVRSRRSLYAAKVASDLVLNIRDHCIQNGKFGCWVYMSKVTVLGFSFGAHIASQICINVYKKSGQKVGKLIGESLTWSFIH